MFVVFVVNWRPSAREWDRGRERRSRGEYREYERGRRERFSPPRHDMSPQQKRMRRDWYCLFTYHFTEKGILYR